MQKLLLPSEDRNMMGGDPECFLVDKRGYIGPIHRFEHAIPVEGFSELTKKPIGHRDGAAFEFNLRPNPCRGSMMVGVRASISRTIDFARSNGLEVQMRAQRRILAEYLTDAPPDMMKGGCDPDYDAYSGALKEPDRYNNTYRYAGGHMHFGIDTSKYMPDYELLEIYAGAVTLLDIFVGIPLVAIGGSENAKEEMARRRYYGQAGSFRVQPHGFEYRTPSSLLYSDPVLLSGMFGMARIVLNSYFNQHYYEKLSPNRTTAATANANLRILDEMAVRHMIDMVDYREAQRFCMEELFPRIGYIKKGLKETYTKDYHVIATGLAALTYGAMQGHHLSRKVNENWASTQGPALALGQYDHWPWFKYVKEFVPTFVIPRLDEIEDRWNNHSPDCTVCGGRAQNIGGTPL